MSEAISAREAQSLRIREALLHACGELLAQKPVDAITINNIVETAGVAKGSFYNHFADKEALAAEVSAVIRADMEALVTASNRNVTDPAYRMVRGICLHLQLAVSEPRRAIIMLRGAEWSSTTRNPLNEGIRNDIAEGVASGRFERRSKDAGVIQVLGAAFFTMLQIVEQEQSAEQAIELATSVLTLLLCGFGLPEEEATRIVADSARDLIKG